MANTIIIPTFDTDLNVGPYYDDFDPKKNYYKELFVPSLGVQARELTQMQTRLQYDQAVFMSHIFKEGSKVRGGEFKLDLSPKYLKLKDQNVFANTINVVNFANTVITGATSNVSAYVIAYASGTEAEAPNTNTLIIKFTKNGSATSNTFSANENISSNTGFSATVLNNAACVGNASMFTIEGGYVFAKGVPVRFDRQSIILDKYTNIPTCRIGFRIQEEIIDYSDDSTLNDPAAGSPNYAAPGQHRLKVTAVLAKYSLANTAPINFIELMQVKDGVIQEQVERPQYADLRNEFARRTYDESGDYVVRGFGVRVKQHLDTDETDGFLTLANGGNNSLLVAGVEPGLAYVRGYDYENLVTRWLPFDKGIDYKDVEQVQLASNYGNYILISEVCGSFNVNDGTIVDLYNAAQGKVTNVQYSTGSPTGSKIGEARVKAIKHHSGTTGTAACQYKLYLYDIVMTSDDFKSVRSVYLNNTSGTSDAFGDVVLSGGNAVIYESGFNSGVYALPLKAIRRIRDSAGTIDTSFEFVKSFAVTIDGAGTFSVSTGLSDEVYPFGAGALNSTQKLENFLVIMNENAQVTLTGSVSGNSGNNIITGSGTTFTTQLDVGNNIKINGTVYKISQIDTNTQLRLASNLGGSVVANTAYRYYESGEVIDFTAAGTTGTERSITVASTTLANFDMKETLDAAATATVICNLTKTDAREKRKVLKHNRYVRINVGTSTNQTSGPWCLGLADVFKINSVRKHTSAFTSSSQGSDFTSSIILDNGQRDTHYGLAWIGLAPGASVANTDHLLVDCEFFAHDTSQGISYLSVDSYPIDDVNTANTSAIQTEEIPIYKSPVTGISYDLRDCIDCRPKVTNTAADTNVVTSSSTNPSATEALSVPTGGLHTPVPNEEFTMDLSYYLTRRDLVVMDILGNYKVVRGIPSQYPITPATPDDAMALASTYVTPYPSLPPAYASEIGRPDYAVKITPKQIRRYTMRDIGVIDQSVKILNYYNSLTLLEKQAADMKIIDSDGLDRFKNGFIVDAFTGHNIGDIGNIEYKCAIDPVNKELRCKFDLHNVRLSYDSASSSNIVRAPADARITITSNSAFVNNDILYQGASFGSASATGTLKYKVGSYLYLENVTGTFSNTVVIKSSTSSVNSAVSFVRTQAEGPLVTLPYTYSAYISQPYATTTRNSSGFLYNWVGNLALYPSEDYWVDTTTSPDIRINFDNNNDGWTANSGWTTSWNDWQTVWSGQPEITTTEETTNGRRLRVAGGILASTVTTTTQTTRQDTLQERTGIRTNISSTLVEQRLGERVTDVGLQPYMRSRLVFFVAQGLKPNTRFYPFFDGVDVSDYCVPVEITQNALASVSGALSTFTISEAAQFPGFRFPTGVLSASSEGVFDFTPAAIMSNTNGQLAGVFFLPNEVGRRFTVGNKVFRLTDNLTNAVGFGLATSSAEATYSSSGLIQNKQDTIISTRMPVVTRETVSETRQITDVSSRVWSGTSTDFEQGDDDDPICQSVLIRTGSVTGGFFGKVDLFFQSTHATLPCVIEIREMENPNIISNKVVPFSRTVLYPADINTSVDGSAPTPVYFEAPVFLGANKTYALVIKPAASNPDYRLWIAKLGDIDLVSGQRVTSQPYVGSLFASSNDNTWNAIQDEDLKFTLYRCVFDTEITGTLRLNNADRDFFTITGATGQYDIPSEPIWGETRLTISGLTGGTPVVGQTIYQASSNSSGVITNINGSVYRVKDVPLNYKFTVGNTLTFKYANGSVTGATSNCTLLGIPKALRHYYNANTLHVSDSANTAFANGEQIIGQYNGYSTYIHTVDSIKYSTFQPTISQLVFPLTDIDWTVKTTSNSAVIDTTWTSVMVNDNNYADAEKVVYSDQLDDKSLQYRALMTSDIDFLSPAVDIERISTVLVHNKINNDSTGETNPQGGNAHAKYLHKKVVLTENQDAEDIRVRFAAHKPPESTIKVYYKILHAEDSDIFDDIDWTEMSTNATTYSDRENRRDFIEYEYYIPTAKLTGPNAEVQYINSAGITFTGFRVMVVKIVMLSSDSAHIPRIRDFQAICLQK